MTSNIIAVLFVIASVGLYFGYTSDAITHIKDLRSQVTSQDVAFDHTRQITKKKQELIEKRNSISADDQARLSHLIPDSVDTVRLISEVNRIAAQNGVEVKSLDIKGGDASRAGKPIGPDDSPVGAVQIDLAVNSTYPRFFNLMNDLERSLRIMDITSVNVVAAPSSAGSGARTPNTGVYQYTISAKTYWLKQ